MSKPEPLRFDAYYHIYNRGNNGEIIFRQKRNYLYFLQLYIKHMHPIADTYAYCLMSNHFHFLTRIKSEAEIGALRVSRARSILVQPSASQVFGNLCNAYAKAINKAYGRTGSLFEHPFGRIPVTTDGYFVNLVTYIHRNPQKHGFVDDFRDWPYSSYDAILLEKPTRVQRVAVLEWFGGLDNFLAEHQQAPDETLITHLIGNDM